MRKRAENKIFQHVFNLVQILRIVNNIRNNSITFEVEYETLELKDPSDCFVQLLCFRWKKKKKIQIYSVQ